MAEEKKNQKEMDRRGFLKASGKYAVATPAAVTFLLSTTLSTQAVARSGGVKHGGGKHLGWKAKKKQLKWKRRVALRKALRRWYFKL